MEQAPRQNLETRELEAYISDINDEGEGVVKYDGAVIFCERGIVGDKVRLLVTKNKGNYYKGRVLSFLERSKALVEAPCPMYEACGGCSLGEMRYDAQCHLKQTHIEQKLRRALPTARFQLRPILQAKTTHFYRNNVQLKVSFARGVGVKIGFYAKNSHDVVSLRNCLLIPPAMSNIIEGLSQFLNEAYLGSTIESEPGFDHKELEKLSGLILRTNETGRELMLIAQFSKPLAPWLGHHEEFGGLERKARDLLARLKVTSVLAQVGERVEAVYGEPYLRVSLAGARYRVAANAFFQVNYEQAGALFALVKEKLEPKPRDTVVDLFCGVGALSLVIAPAVKSVLGIEVVPEAIKAAEENARLNGLRNAEFVCGAVEELLSDEFIRDRGIAGAKILLDPPRSGVKERALKVLARIGGSRIVYVSCNPATLARDLKVLSETGYGISEVVPLDLFPHTVHTECVVVLEKRV